MAWLRATVLTIRCQRDGVAGHEWSNTKEGCGSGASFSKVPAKRPGYSRAIPDALPWNQTSGWS